MAKAKESRPIRVMRRTEDGGDMRASVDESNCQQPIEGFTLIKMN